MTAPEYVCSNLKSHQHPISQELGFFQQIHIRRFLHEQDVAILWLRRKDASGYG